MSVWAFKLLLSQINIELQVNNIFHRFRQGVVQSEIGRLKLGHRKSNNPFGSGQIDGEVYIHMYKDLSFNVKREYKHLVTNQKGLGFLYARNGTRATL